MQYFVQCKYRAKAGYIITDIYKGFRPIYFLHLPH